MGDGPGDDVVIVEGPVAGKLLSDIRDSGGKYSPGIAVNGPGNDVFRGVTGTYLGFVGDPCYSTREYARGNRLPRCKTRLPRFGYITGAGNDAIYAQRGSDGADPAPGHLLAGGVGNDRIYGGPYSDILSGGGGDDRLYGGRGHDEVFSGTGDDRLYGGPGDDCLSGGPGRNALFGGSGRILTGLGYCFQREESLKARFLDGQ